MSLRKGIGFCQQSEHPNRSDALLDAYFAPNTLFCSLKHELWKENYYNFDE